MAYDYERDLKSKSTSIDIDLGLRAYMNKVYSFMAVGLALTGVIAILHQRWLSILPQIPTPLLVQLSTVHL